ncbi:response regulator [Streptomyces sp. NPDC051555]|uniref:response regulator n=1 Tax=Streptomyces sp. NPDC051555 TaxID=3365657 RepID=UPI003793B8C1
MVIRVLLADDNAITRWGIRAIIESSADIVVVAEAVDGHDALEKARIALPDVALLDLAMPRLDGLTAARTLVDLPQPPRVVVLTTFHEDRQVHAALEAGVAAFLLKDTAPADLLEAIRAVHRGHWALDPEVARRLVDNLSERSSRLTPEERRRLEGLTPREGEILVLLAQGLSNAAIGAGLGISEGTVKGRVGLILDKLGAASRVQAANLAYRAGIAIHDER